MSCPSRLETEWSNLKYKKRKIIPIPFAYGDSNQATIKVQT